MNDNPSPLLLVIVGPMAVGKMSVGRVIAERIGLKLFHNHMSIEVAAALFDYDDPAFQRVNMGIRRLILEESAAGAGPGLILTRVHLFDNPAEQALSAEYERPFRARGARVLTVELQADAQERLRRTEGASRLAAKPTQRDLRATQARLSRMDALYQLDSGGRFDGPDWLRIDSTLLTPEEVAERVIRYFRLPVPGGGADE